MRSPWEPAIAQTLQRHGGSHHSVPRSAKANPSAGEPKSAPPEASKRADEKPELKNSGKPAA